jgi:mitochondrial cardiolipin hydrolase
MGSYVKSYFSPSRDAVREVIGFIRRCETTLDVAIYSLTHDEITAELLAAHERGTVIRLLIDKTQAGNQYADDEQLEAAGVQIRRDRKGGLMHAKYALDAGKAVALGSFNWTRSAEIKNVEHLSIIRLQYVVKEFQSHFDTIWELNAPPEEE